MSRLGLADLLNPAPSSTRQSPAPQSIDTASVPDPTRLPSLASPLEGLALAAASQPDAARDASPSQPANLEAPPPPDAMSMATSAPVEMNTENGFGHGPSQADTLMTEPIVKQEPAESLTPLQDTKPAVHEGTPTIKEELVQPERSSIPPQNVILPTTEKSRPPPKAAPKKAPGTTKKAAPRKRKADQASKDGTPFSQRSGTPASSRAGKPSALAQSSPARSFTGEDDEDGGVFCICRGPDDHTWMIGCDGECEDWFHGRCVNMRQEDADLIDKYICPTCAKKGMGVTTWKPMCRLEGCRQPARVTGPAPSKYCSDEHGREFMRQRVLQRSNRDKQPAKKKRHADEQVAGTLHSTSEVDGAHQAYLRGGLLEIGEIKALTDGIKDTAEFKRLGESVLPVKNCEVNGDGANHAAVEDAPQTDDGPEITEANDDTCVPEERAHLENVLAKAAGVRHQLGALRDKEKFLGLVRTRATQLAADLAKASGDTKKKDAGKDICGFDARLSWSDVEFDEWRLSPKGQSALGTSNLGPPPATEPALDGDGDTTMQDSPTDEPARGICPKKRCERHKTWYKLHQQEIAYDRRECEEHLAKLGREAGGIQERAILKKLEQQGSNAI